MGTRLIRIGTRASALARAQTAIVATGLIDAHPDLGLEIELVAITTGGDRSQATNEPGPDWGTGVFVKEIEAALLRDEIDLAVHSLKDVPPIVTAELTLAAIPVRDDPLDDRVVWAMVVFQPPILQQGQRQHRQQLRIAGGGQLAALDGAFHDHPRARP